MADRNSELNDIILNGKQEKNRTNRRILLGIGGMTLLLIVIVTIMGRIMHTEEDQLPTISTVTQKTIETVPEKSAAVVEEALEEINKNTNVSDTIEIDAITEQITNKLKEENLSKSNKPQTSEVTEKVEIESRSAKVEPRPEVTPTTENTSAEATNVTPTTEIHKKIERTKTVTKPVKKDATPTTGDVYIQVGAFSKYKPDNSFLSKITSAGYDYTFYRVVKNGSINNKVLVGPFLNKADARKNLTKVRKAVETGAFIYTIN